MSDRPLPATTTGEPFQPVRLHYSVRDRRRLEACLRKLRCMDFDEDRNRWVWLYDGEASFFKFEQSWKSVSKCGAVVLGSFHIRDTGAVELYLRSIERTLMAVAFFDEHVPRTVARLTDMDVANRLFSVDERHLGLEALFAAAEGDLRRQAVEHENFLANPMRMMAELFLKRRKQLPEFERLPTYFYEDGIEPLTTALGFRQCLAMEHWMGNHDITLFDLIQRSVTGQTVSGTHGSPGESRGRPTRINWDFGPEVPVLDFFETFDLSCPYDLAEAVEDFISDMEKDEFRTWEATIREEQGLATMPVLTDLAAELMCFGEPDEDDPVYYLNDIPRSSEPWYEILRKIAPQLIIEPLRTAGMPDDVFLTGWPHIAAWVEQRARGLSLPEGVRRPLDVVPEELRHRLWLQSCFDPLCGLGQAEVMTLDEEEEHWRIDDFCDLLQRHRDSVEFLGLTLDSLLERCELPDRDRPILIRMVSDRFGLSGTDELLAPKLDPAAGWPDEPGEPIARLSNEEIRQAILHSEPAVHRAAMRYFAGADSGDPNIAPLVIESMQAMKDDRDRTFACVCLKKLVQTDETSERILQELKALRPAGDEADRYRHAVASSLLAAGPSFLASNKRNILAAITDLDPMLQDDFEARISDQTLDIDDRWAMFVHLVHDDELFNLADDVYPGPGFVERVECLIRGMGDDERLVRWVMETLSRTVNDGNYSSDRELIAVSLSGMLRLREAIPYLIALLHDDDPEMVEQAVRSLSRIGSDTVIEALDQWFADAGQHFRLQAAMVLQHIHSDRSIRTLQKWSRNAKDESAQCRVRQALLEQFVTSEIDRAHQWMIDANPTCEEVGGLRRALVVDSLVAGRDFAELDDWLAAVREDLASESSSEDFSVDDDPWDEDDEDWDEDDEDWDEDDEDWDEDADLSGEPFSLSHHGRAGDDPQSNRDLSPLFDADVVPITNSGRKIGRNEPCPCGSGKKFKKCCARKQGGKSLSD